MNNTLEDVGVERPAADTAVVTFTGEHDLATRDAVGVLLGSLVDENDLVVVDFSEAKFVDSATIHTLFTVDSAARERGAKLRLQLGTAAVVEKAFELCGVLERLECASSRDEASQRASLHMIAPSEHQELLTEEWERDREAWNLPSGPAPATGSESGDPTSASRPTTVSTRGERRAGDDGLVPDR